MATQIVSDAPAKLRQFTLRNVMVWIGVLGFFWAIPTMFPMWTVGAILATVVFCGFILGRITGWTSFRNVAVTPVVLFSGFYFLLTGFPFPVYHIERLHKPVAVTQVDKDVLQLVDGRQISLPLIKEIPADDPVFNMALRHGVEVSDNGDVYGLAEWPRFCGNDPVVYNLRRVNLTELAAALHPTGLDDAAVPVAEINRLAANPSMWKGRVHLPVDRLYEVRRVTENRR